MAELHDIAAIRNALGAQMARTGLKPKALSKKAGLNETAVRDLMDRVDDPRIGTLFKLAQALGCSPSTLFGGLVQVAGYVRDGGEITSSPWCDGKQSYVQRPPEAVGELMAFRIDSDTHGPAYRQGDVVFVAHDDENVVPGNYIGEECIVHLTTGALMFKTLEHSLQSGRFTLRSHSAADIEDVQLAWAAPVLFLMRSRSTNSAE
jgi:repressor LexA